MSIRVTKFGGTSLASAEQFRKVKDIIMSQPDRRYVVASAPGKRFSDDIKVTDLLNESYRLAAASDDFHPVLQKIHDRFSDILTELSISGFPLDEEIEIIAEHLGTSPNADYLASRGEYLNSKILASFLGYTFVDPAGLILFDDNGNLDSAATRTKLGERLGEVERAVVAGFYGSYYDGTVKTFSRGGSDITGSLVAQSVRADIYENWTDVSGMLAADPRIVNNPVPIDYISYQELRELSYMGASVLHEDAVFPVRESGIPINIRNTNRPDDPGTMIMAKLKPEMSRNTVTGIAGKKGFSIIQIEKALMNNEVGYVAKLLGILAKYEISFDHVPTGIDTVSVVVDTDTLHPVKREVIHEIFTELEPDTLFVENGISLIAVVGLGMIRTKGVAARTLKAISDADINIRMLDQGSSELNIILGVNDDDYENAIRSIYKELWS